MVWLDTFMFNTNSTATVANHGATRQVLPGGGRVYIRAGATIGEIFPLDNTTDWVAVRRLPDGTSREMNTHRTLRRAEAEVLAR